MKSYEIYFETDCGMACEFIEAENARAMMRQLKENNPDDIGADGFYIDAEGDEHALKW